MHRMVTADLKNDGSKTPGAFRKTEVKIANSSCVVSPAAAVQADMQELVDYINADDGAKNDIIKIACAHHRFVAIHPFDNGNGRTARLLTYTMLIKYGFLRNGKAILNPSSIFCMDRDRYYKELEAADTMKPARIEEWCLYVAEGIYRELEKTRNLLDKDYAVGKLILPAVKNAREKQLISVLEYNILVVAMEKDIIQASDVMHLFGPERSDATRCSRCLSQMVEDGLLMHPPKYPKKYVARFFSPKVLPGVLEAMVNEGLLESE